MMEAIVGGIVLLIGELLAKAPGLVVGLFALFLIGLTVFGFHSCDRPAQETEDHDARLDVIEVYPVTTAVTRNPAVCTETVSYYVYNGQGIRCKKGSITAVSMGSDNLITLSCSCN